MTNLEGRVVLRRGDWRRQRACTPTSKRERRPRGSEQEDDEVVRFSEPRRGVYKAAIVRDGKVVCAILLADRAKASFLTQAFDCGTVLPQERAALLRLLQAAGARRHRVGLDGARDLAHSVIVGSYQRSCASVGSQRSSRASQRAIVACAVRWWSCASSTRTRADSCTPSRVCA
jgi:hypothetical protein